MKGGVQPMPVLNPWSLESAGLPLVAMSALISNVASAIWPTANLAIYVPFTLSVPAVIQKLYWVDGATLSGNVDMGVYATDGTRLVSAGSTDQTAGTVNTPRVVTPAALPLLIPAGLYYMALVMDNITGTIFSVAPPAALNLVTAGFAQEASAFALPATMAPATITTAYVPLFGLAFRTLV